jgi:hypothetical protein
LNASTFAVAPLSHPGRRTVRYGVRLGQQRLARRSGDFHADQAILDVADLVRNLACCYHVAELAFDPWRAGQLAQELEREGVKSGAFRRTTPTRSWR